MHQPPAFAFDLQQHLCLDLLDVQLPVVVQAVHFGDNELVEVAKERDVSF